VERANRRQPCGMPTYTRADGRLDFRLPQSLADQVRAIAHEEGESLGSVMRRVLRQFVADVERKHREQEQAAP